MVIAWPADPVNLLFFNHAIDPQPQRRIKAAATVSLYVALVLGGSALAGRHLLDLLGVDLDAFGVAGGLIIALIGFEMLYGGAASLAQGQRLRRKGPMGDDALLIPLTIPLIAGPGAIATTISITSQREAPWGLLAALISVAIVVIATFLTFAWLGHLVAQVKPTVMALLARLGGLLLATFGVQMLLGGLRNFFQ